MEQGDGNTTVGHLKAAVRRFVRDREWERFHTPRNLAESICIESAELLEIFQWASEHEDPVAEDTEVRERIEEELSDVLVYCISLANAAEIDIARAVLSKTKKNEEKYPIEKYRGTYVKPRKI